MAAHAGHRFLPLVEALKTAAVLAVVLGLIALGLRILNLLPPYVSPPPVRDYPTVDEARRATGVPLYLPAYFPEYLQWPPVQVRGWTAPVPRVSIVAALRVSGQPVLWLEEWLPRLGALEPAFPEGVLDRPQAVKRANVVLRSGITAELVEYRDSGGKALYQLAWEQPELKLVLTAALPLGDVLNMAGSMYAPASY